MKGKVAQDAWKVQGDIITWQGESWYCISGYDRMDPFLISLVSPLNHWMYLSSAGSLTAGRKDADNSLFPYYTEDMIHRLRNQVGSFTACRVHSEAGEVHWRPFHPEFDSFQQVERRLYKHVLGHTICFEEHNKDLNLTFRYTWQVSDRFGFIRRSELENHNEYPVSLSIIDGIRYLMPWGVRKQAQMTLSSLMNAYRKNEWYGDLALYRLSSIPVDRAEPSEALRATVAWTAGWTPDALLLSDVQVNTFLAGGEVVSEQEMKATEGALLGCRTWSLQPRESVSWYIGADVAKDATEIDQLAAWRQQPQALDILQQDLLHTEYQLLSLLQKVDGLQVTGQANASVRHGMNAIFNAMRGGLAFHKGAFPRIDLIHYLRAANRQVAATHEAQLLQLPEWLTVHDVESAAKRTTDKDLARLLTEYLPIGFSRRHGDPSRPWNTFSIQIRDEAGYDLLYYEGNWRDIFQNWEALSWSQPYLLKGMVSKFLNASTIDGYNPYRIGKNGIDWEVLEPDDDWSYVGYWGDHQLIYLLKLMQRLEAAWPGELAAWLTDNRFVCADVPYRLTSFADMVANPFDTIRFDEDRDHHLRQQMDTSGFDAVACRVEGATIYVNLLEKWMISVLAKISHFIPDAGIWLNTQRPEWNDANNALVGRGASMVTTCQLHQFLQFMHDVLQQSTADTFQVSALLADWWAEVVDTASMILQPATADREEHRWAVAQRGGEAATRYREQVYAGKWAPQVPLAAASLRRQVATLLEVFGQVIREQQGQNGLYHAYNLVAFRTNHIRVTHLYPMLEGQVAVLETGLLSPNEAVDLLDTLRHSSLYEARQQSYLLYPDRQLPEFMHRNRVAGSDIRQLPVLWSRLQAGDMALLKPGVGDSWHFHPDFRNDQQLKARLAGSDLPPKEQETLLDWYESAFHHASFTGRSGTFYGYEGLGSIYWHMVSKLLVAVQGAWLQAHQTSADMSVVDALWQHYREIREGIGANKSPEVYGAFPVDPYSHTPGGRGARQPGMTGQVKEDVIARFRELGVVLHKGTVSFRPVALEAAAWLTEATTWHLPGTAGSKSLTLPAKSLAFTLMTIPVIYVQEGISLTLDEHEWTPYWLQPGEVVPLTTWLGMEEKTVVVVRVGKV